MKIGTRIVDFEAMFVKIGPRVLDFWLEKLFRPNWPEISFWDLDLYLKVYSGIF